MGQHYVTESYLGQFASMNKVWSLNGNNKNYYKQYSISEICNKPNLHTLQLEESLKYLNTTDSNIIEGSFWRFENYYRGIIDNFRKSVNEGNKRISLTEKQKETIIEMLVYNKIRHPKHRKKMVQYLTENLTKDHIIAEAKKKNIQANISEINVYLKNLESNSNKQDDLYNISLTDGIPIPITILMNCYWELLIINDDINEFVTSDSPGFIVLSNGELLQFGGWGYTSSYYFPLTPELMLSIRNYMIEDNINEFINLKEVDRHIIDYLNDCTYRTKHQYVYGKSKEFIMELKEKYQK